MPTRWHMMSEKQLSILIQERKYARGNRQIIRIPRAFACISAGAPWLWRSVMQIDKVSQEPARLRMLTAPFHGTFFFHGKFIVHGTHGPLFTKRTGFLPQDLVKYRSRENRIYTLLNRYEIWQAHRQHRCRDACQLSERYGHHHTNIAASRLREILRQDILALSELRPCLSTNNDMRLRISELMRGSYVSDMGNAFDHMNKTNIVFDLYTKQQSHFLFIRQ